MRRYLSSLLLAFCLVCCGIVLAALSGCAVGRNELDGSIVLGFKAGQLVENTNQAIGAAAGLAGTLFPGPLGQIVGLLGLGAAAHYSGKERGWNEATGTPPQPQAAPGARV